MYKNYSSLDLNPVEYAISLISGELTIENGTIVYSQDYFMNSFSSVITVDNLSISNWSISSTNLIALTSTSFTVNSKWEL